MKGYDLSTLKSILQSSSLEYVVVITNCHPTVHTWSLHPAKDWNIEDRSGFDKLEEQVLMWMGNVNLTAEIFYLPLFMVTLTSRELLIPTYHPYTPSSPSLPPWLGQREAKDLVLGKGNSLGRKLNM